MISATISGGSIKRALQDISRSSRRKSFRKNRPLLRKISRRFVKASRDAGRDMAKPIARFTGLTLTQAKRRVRHTKRISSRSIYSEVYTRGTVLNNSRRQIEVATREQARDQGSGRTYKGRFRYPGNIRGKERTSAGTGSRATQDQGPDLRQR